MTINGYTDHAGLQALLEFESTRLNTPLTVRHVDLNWDTLDSQNQLSVLVHDAGRPVDFGIHLDGRQHRVSVPLWLPPDDVALFGPLDEQGQVQPVVSVLGHRVAIHVPPRLLDGLALKLLGPALEAALPLAKAAYEKAVLSQEAERYVALKETAWIDRLERRRTEVQEAERLLLRLEEDLRHRYRALTQSREELRSLEAQVLPALRRSARSEMSRLRGMCPRALEAVRLDGEKLALTTAPITIEYEDFAYEMGRYTITIDLRGSSIRIRALDHPVRSYPHPHVSPGGEPCLGSMSSPIAHMLAEGDMFGIVVGLLEYLASYNPASPYLELENWNPDHDSNERWDSCYEDAGPQDCVTCDQSDCPHRDGASDRCWEVQDSWVTCIGCRDCDWASVAQDRCRDDHSPAECVACPTDACSYANEAEACHDSHEGDDCAGCENDTCRHWAEANEQEEEEDE